MRIKLSFDVVEQDNFDHRSPFSSALPTPLGLEQVPPETAKPPDWALPRPPPKMEVSDSLPDKDQVFQPRPEVQLQAPVTA